MDQLDNVSFTNTDRKFQHIGLSDFIECLVNKQLIVLGTLFAIMQGFSALSLDILGQIFLCLEKLSWEL